MTNALRLYGYGADAPALAQKLTPRAASFPTVDLLGFFPDEAAFVDALLTLRGESEEPVVTTDHESVQKWVSEHRLVPETLADALPCAVYAQSMDPLFAAAPYALVTDALRATPPTVSLSGTTRGKR